MLTEKEKRYFNSTRPLVKTEVALVQQLVEKSGALTQPEENTIRYAINLAKIGPFRIPSGEDIDLFEELTPFRRKVVELLSSAMGPSFRDPDYISLVRLVPQLQDEILIARYMLMDNHADKFGEDHLDDEVCNKRLVSVAGGGGGSGTVYVGAYRLLEDHGIKPSYIVGSSIGSIIGSMRAYFTDFDLALIGREISRAGISMADVLMLRPPATQSHFGLPAAIRLELYPVAEKLFRGLGKDIPTFDDMPIPFHAVVAGIKRGRLKHNIDYYAAGSSAPKITDKGTIKIRPGTIMWYFKSINSILREFSNPDTLVEVVFGRDEPTDKLKVVDGVGFSCAIPAVLNYDIFRYDPDTAKRMKELMENNDLVSLVDGGAVNNVPSRVAWESVYRGVIGSRNAFILAFDSFSPQLNGNILFVPAQRLLQRNVRANLQFSTYTKVFGSVPNPLRLIGRTKTMLRQFNRGTTDLTPELPFIHRMLKSLKGPRERFGA